MTYFVHNQPYMPEELEIAEADARNWREIYRGQLSASHMDQMFGIYYRRSPSETPRGDSATLQKVIDSHS